MGEVSIIVNGVRYDAIDSPMDGCQDCDLCSLYDGKGLDFPCIQLIGYHRVFKKSDKTFEK